MQTPGAEVEVAKGLKTPQVCKNLGIAEQPYFRWWKEYDVLRSPHEVNRSRFNR